MSATVSFPITSDTYIDSRSANAELNYGQAGTAKVVVNNNTTGDGSVCRALFHFPDEVWVYPTNQVLCARVFLYVWQDNTGTRNVTLYPLAEGFAEGSGSGTASSDGATWLTRDGTNAWTEAGGSLDDTRSVVGDKGEIIDPDLHDRFFSWDVTALLNDPTARAELHDHGALLRIDEIPAPSSGMPRAPFTSSDDLGYSPPYRPRVELTLAPNTSVVRIAASEPGSVSLSISQLTPHVTNRIERTLSLTAQDWTTVVSFATSGTFSNWSEAFPAGATSVYYRVRSD